MEEEKKQKGINLTRNIVGIASGHMGTGKTLFATYLASGYPYVYGNYNIINHKNFSRIDSIIQLKKLKTKYKRGLIVIDEANMIFNSRRSMSKINEVIIEMITLSRKLNCDIIFLGQLFDNIDVFLRKMCDFHISLIRIGNHPLLFTIKADVSVRSTNKNDLYYSHSFLIKNAGFNLKKTGLNYDTSDFSEIK